MNEETKKGQESGQVILQIDPELRDVEYRNRLSKDSRSWQDLKDYYDTLDKDKYGLDGNGIYFKNEYLLTFSSEGKVPEDGKLHAIQMESKLEIELDLHNDNFIFRKKGKATKKFRTKKCPCGSNVVKIVGKGAHKIMEGGSGSTPRDSKTLPGLKRIQGAGRNYLTYFDQEYMEGGLSDLAPWIEQDEYYIGENGSPIVAVIDTGLDLFLSNKDEEKSFKLWKNPGKACKKLDNDSYGYNFVHGNENVFDDHGHGTEVTSVFVQHMNAGKRNMEYRIMPLKAFNYEGQGGSYEIACAIYYAIDHGAKIIIASWGGVHQDPNVYLALKQAESRGIQVFVACGNFGEKITDTGTPFYPALYQVEPPEGYSKLKNLHSIAATEYKKDDKFWKLSNYYEDVLASDGDDVEVITCSYSFATTQIPPDHFAYIRNLPPVAINGMNIDLNYVTKIQDGTSFAAPKVAAKWLIDKNLPGKVQAHDRGVDFEKVK